MYSVRVSALLAVSGVRVSTLLTAGKGRTGTGRLGLRETVDSSHQSGEGQSLVIGFYLKEIMVSLWVSCYPGVVLSKYPV